LAGTFVNAFVNAGYGNDKLIVDVEEGQSFIYKNKDHGMSISMKFQPQQAFILRSTGMLSATASLGMSMLWDTELGISQVDKYSYSSEEHIKVSSKTRLNLAALLTSSRSRPTLGWSSSCYWNLAQRD
jgi:26S proteasome regulatory subunit N1